MKKYVITFVFIISSFVQTNAKIEDFIELLKQIECPENLNTFLAEETTTAKKVFKLYLKFKKKMSTSLSDEALQLKELLFGSKATIEDLHKMKCLGLLPYQKAILHFFILDELFHYLSIHCDDKTMLNKKVIIGLNALLETRSNKTNFKPMIDWYKDKIDTMIRSQKSNGDNEPRTVIVSERGVKEHHIKFYRSMWQFCKSFQLTFSPSGGKIEPRFADFIKARSFLNDTNDEGLRTAGSSKDTEVHKDKGDSKDSAHTPTSSSRSRSSSTISHDDFDAPDESSEDLSPQSSSRSSHSSPSSYRSSRSSMSNSPNLSPYLQPSLSRSLGNDNFQLPGQSPTSRRYLEPPLPAKPQSMSAGAVKQIEN